VKKLIFIFGIGLVLFAVLAAGCLGGNGPSDNTSNNPSGNTSGNSSNNTFNNTSTNSSDNTSGNSSNNTSNNSSNNTPQIAPPIAPPANTTKFFGRVTDIQKVYGMPVIVLSNYKDQNFIFSNDSQTNFHLSDLQTRPYIEVYVATPVVVPSPEPIPVVVANIRDIDHYTGYIVNVTPSSPESFSDIQSIEVRSIFGVTSWDSSSVIFHCNETQFHIDLQDIKIGTTVVVVYDKSTVLEGLPQAKASEISRIHIIVD